MANAQRPVDRLAFNTDDLEPVVSWMDRLARAQDGWINLLAETEDSDNARSPRLGILALFGGGSSGVTLGTWIPGGLQHHGSALPSLGITHNLARRVALQLHEGPIGIPDSWRVEQDHPRRGLILRIPAEEANDTVLRWALRALSALTIPPPPPRWRADVHRPLDQGS
jgi:hypothetical protein